MLSTATELTELYTDTFISHDENEVPFKLMKIWTQQLNTLKLVADDIQSLNDINNLIGKSLDKLGEKWQVLRQGKTDAELLNSIVDQMYLYFSGSTIPDFVNALISFDAPAGSTVTERVPPEDAEVNVFLNGADSETVERLTRVLNVIKAGGVEIDVTNANTGDKLLAQNDDFLVYQDGDYILLN